MKPTLLVKGSLKDYFGDPEKAAELERYVPMDYIVERTKEMLNETGRQNRVLIVKAMTASGKSTALPATIYTKFIADSSNKKRGLICTQPKVITAINNIKDITPYYPKLQLGTTIGWSTQYNKLRPLRYGFLSATIGTLMQQLMSMTDQELMDRYKFIMIDEVHERSIQIDTTLYYLRNFLDRNADNPNCPVIFLMSATFDPEPLIKFFDISFDNFIYVTGRSFPIKTHWLSNTPKNIFEAAINAVKEIIAGDGTYDILIFMVGKAEIQEVASSLHKLNKTLPANKILSISGIDSEAVNTMNDDYQRAINVPIAVQKIEINGKKVTPTRRVIVSSNVAETGLTLPNLGHVIDSGYNRQIINFPNYNVAGLLTIPVSVSSVLQRKGRAGRKFAGHFYPLYTKETCEVLQKQRFPDIIIDDSVPLVLSIICEQTKLNGKFVMDDLTLIDAPPTEMLLQSIERLYLLGFISIKDTTLIATEMAHIVNNVTGIISIEAARMIFAGFSWNVSIMDLITIAAYVTTQQPKNPPNFDKIVEYTVVDSATPDEFLQGLILFKYLDKSLKNGEHNILEYYFEQLEYGNVDQKFAREFLTNREKLIMKLISLEVDILKGDPVLNSEYKIVNLQNLKFCIYDGYRCNLINYIDGKYRTKHGGLEVKTNSFAQYKEFPKTIVTSGIKLQINRKNNFYDLKLKYTSIMDGFVPIDNDYYV